MIFYGCKVNFYFEKLFFWILRSGVVLEYKNFCVLK